MTSSNPFLKIKARNLLVWFVISIPFTIIVALLTGILLGLFFYFNEISINQINFTDPLISILIQYLWLYGVISIWIYEKIQLSQLHFQAVLGKFPRGNSWLRLLLLIIPILFFSLGSSQIIYYLISLFNPNLVTSLINQKSFLTVEETAAPFLANILQLIATIFIAPIIEEILFRGILLQRWSVKWGIIPGTIISSLIFGILHLNFIGLSIFGLTMALVYLKTKTLFIPILLHMLNNFMAIAFELNSYLLNQEMPNISLKDFQSQWWLGLVYIGLSLPWLILFMRRNWPMARQTLPYFFNKDN